MKYSSAICLAGDFSSGYQSVTAVKTPISLALLTISQDILDPPKINNFFPFKDFNIISPFYYFSNIIKLYKLVKIILLLHFIYFQLIHFKFIYFINIINLYKLRKIQLLHQFF